MRLFEKKEPQLFVRVAIVDGKYKFKFTIEDSNIDEVFDMFERVIAANEVPEKGTLTMVSMREIKGHKNGKFKSIKVIMLSWGLLELNLFGLPQIIAFVFLQLTS